MKIGLSTNNFPEEGIPGIIETAKKLGVRYLELWPVSLETAGEPGKIYSFRNRDTAKAKEQLAAVGISVGCLASGIGLEKEYARDRREFVRELLLAVETAHELGAKVLLHYGTAVLDDDCLNLDKLRLYWQDAADLAESYGIVMALENEPDDYTRCPENMRKIVEGFDSPAFRTNYDATNYFHYRMNPQAFPFGYMWLKDYIAYVHIKNAMLFNSRFHKESAWIGTPIHGKEEPGCIYYTEADRGVINMAALLDMLHEDGYAGICTPEPLHTTYENAFGRLEHDIAFLRRTGYFEQE